MYISYSDSIIVAADIAADVILSEDVESILQRWLCWRTVTCDGSNATVMNYLYSVAVGTLPSMQLITKALVDWYGVKLRVMGLHFVNYYHYIKSCLNTIGI